jgi:hypothetical protein
MVALVLLLTSAVARAGGDAEPTGLDLLARCHEIDAPQAEDATAQRDQGYCLGYIAGYVSGFAARDATGVAGRFCPPVDARIGDFATAIREWLVLNPDGLDAVGAVVALRAFGWKFPCPEETTREPLR